MFSRDQNDVMPFCNNPIEVIHSSQSIITRGSQYEYVILGATNFDNLVKVLSSGKLLSFP